MKKIKTIITVTALTALSTALYSCGDGMEDISPDKPGHQHHGLSSEAESNGHYIDMSLDTGGEEGEGGEIQD